MDVQGQAFLGVAMKPQPAKFTRDNPCTKLHIHNCFATPEGYGKRPVVDAQAEIGVNVPRVMEREGRLVRRSIKSVDYYVLTEEGERWLSRGIRSYLKNHPDDTGKARYLSGEAPRVRRIRR